jgi:hypothetical protein
MMILMENFAPLMAIIAEILGPMRVCNKIGDARPATQIFVKKPQHA